MRLTLFLLAIACAWTVPAHAQITIDGHINPGEWKGARHITDFRQTQPLTGDPATWPTQAWVLATPKGLAVAFRNAQPASVPRTNQRVQRDFHDQVDRVNLIVDFDGDGRTGYNFTISSTGGIYDAVLTNENHYNTDWDGIWEHAASQDAEGWSAEMLIPWYTAPMHEPESGKRTLGIYLDRVIGSTGERDAWPQASFERTRFLSDFTHVEVPAYSATLLAITPYVSALHDNVRARNRVQEGADILWKPSGQFQLTATLNPDFGQVESDDLVVNFDATETYFSDKRPFFTENQGIFDFGLLDDNSQLIYTRRVGGPADDGHGSSDINAAVKVNGSFGNTNYGVMAADEDGPVGRFFGAARLTHAFDTHTVGAMLTQVRHPYLDRTATVLGADDHWQPTENLTVWTNLVGSQIEQHQDTVRGAGATVFVNYQMADGWRQQWLAMHFDDRLQINDFGYLDRNNFDYLHWEVRKRVTDLPSDSMYSSHDWQFRIDALDNDNQHLRLRRELRIGRHSDLRNGGQQSAQINIQSASWDDLLTRGHGALFLPPSWNAHFEHETPRHGDWAFETEVNLESEAIAGDRRLSWSITWEPTYYVSDAFRVVVSPHVDHDPRWLIWQHDNLVGNFDGKGLQLDAGFDWTISNRQELRFKLQALAINADLRQAYRVNADGRAVASDDPVDDFSVRNLGLQIRYRYELAPLSYLYVVYGRGGYAQDPYTRDGLGLLRDSFALRDDDQLLIKVSYRFDL